MWLWAAVGSAILLGIYDVFKKQASTRNDVLHILLYATALSTVLLSPFILTSVFGWHWLRVDWATNKAGRVSVLLGRPEDGPPHLPAFVEVASDGRTWRRIGETDETTNAVVAEVSESFRSLRVRPGADGGRPLAVREISVEPAAAPF